MCSTGMMTVLLSFLISHDRNGQTANSKAKIRRKIEEIVNSVLKLQFLHSPLAIIIFIIPTWKKSFAKMFENGLKGSQYSFSSP